MKRATPERAKRRSASSTLLFCLLSSLLFWSPCSQASTLLAGSGTNACTFQINFSSGDQLSFIYRFGSISVRAQTALENIITETGGSLLATGYLTDFASALSQLTPPTAGLTVHYQSSDTYPDPYINGILWAPTGAKNGDYLSDADWWQIWVQGPAQLEQPYNNPAIPLNLASGSGWVSPPASGLKDIVLGNGAFFGLVYGSTNAPISPPSSPAPPPVAKSCRTLPGNELEMTFETVPNISYILKTKSSLSDTNWSAVTSVTAATATTTLTVPMTNSAGRAFFRLEISP